MTRLVFWLHLFFTHYSWFWFFYVSDVFLLLFLLLFILLLLFGPAELPSKIPPFLLPGVQHEIVRRKVYYTAP